MNTKLKETITLLSTHALSEDRKQILQPLIDYIQSKKDAGEAIRLQFICTHNSRRSHFAQIWAQTMAFNFGIKNVNCYSGGTQATAMFSKVVETLVKQGFEVEKLSENENPVYALKYDDNEPAILGFSKIYSHNFNPKSSFAAIMTCNQAYEACPLVIGAEARLPITYEDPKVYDGTDLAEEKYKERSSQIAYEMGYIFGSIV